MVTERKRDRQSMFPRQNANWGLPKTECPMRTVFAMAMRNTER